MSYIPNNWKDIAKGHTAFCIFGGPSSNQVENIDEIIQNNFTVTVNHNIKRFPNADMFITADNPIAREYFEKEDFFIHKFEGGKLLKDKSQFKINNSPIWIKSKRDIILQNPKLIKIIACQNIISYNINFSTGQIYEYKGLEYSKYNSNTYICREIRDELTNEVWPVLSPSLPESIKLYGENPLNLPAGGNISGVVFQLLYYMGFDKIIVVGYGDKGESQGYEEVGIKYRDTTQFSWSNEEIHALVIHNKIWGDNLKILKGGEICKEYASYKNATYDELKFNNKKELINKLIKL